MVSCAPKPITSSNAGSLLLPVASYSISMPFALTRATSPPDLAASVPFLPPAATRRPPQSERLAPGRHRPIEQPSREQDRQRGEVDLACCARLEKHRAALLPFAHQAGGGDGVRGLAGHRIVDAQYGEREIGEGRTGPHDVERTFDF